MPDRFAEQGRNIDVLQTPEPKWARFFRGTATSGSITTTTLIFACAALSVLRPDLNITGEMAVGYSLLMGASVRVAEGLYSSRG